jgi:hypothetical protein
MTVAGKLLVAALSVLGTTLTPRAAAQEFAVYSVDFYKDIDYKPPDAWNSASENEVCGTPDHWTGTIGASATISFVGTSSSGLQA